jgi:alkylresorcinol/alkylpyrone synthase
MEQREVRQFAGQLFGEAAFDVKRLLPVFENTTIQERHFCMAPEWFERCHDFPEKNIAYVEEGVALATEAVLDVCRKTGVRPEEIAHIFFISTTGVSTPSIDAHLFNRLKFRPSIYRTPIWGLGCSGGIAGVIRASDWLKAYPGEIALVVALELCGLTFIANDLSKSNFVATSLFGDGCGALLLAGDENPIRTPRMLSVLATAAVTWEDTLDIMGWEIVESGFKVVFSRSIPSLVQRAARPVMLEFLSNNGFCAEDIRYFLSHPGGARVIEAYQEALNLEGWQIQSMRAVLSKYGNMSSATIFFVLQHFLDSTGYREDDLVFSTALGPGFSSEMMLAKCC